MYTRQWVGVVCAGRHTKNQEHVIDFYETARANSSVEHLEASATFKVHFVMKPYTLHFK